MVSRLCFLLTICVALGTHVTHCAGDGPPESNVGDQLHTGSSPQGGVPDAGAGNPSLSVPGQTSQDTEPSSSSSENGIGSSSSNEETASPPTSADAKSNGIESESSDAASVQVEDTSEQNIQITSALLKHSNGIKITGSCKAHFRVFLSPHLWIYAVAAENKIQLRPNFGPITSIDLGNLINDCKKGANNNFKFVVHTSDDILTVKWKVTGEGAAPGNQEDVKKYKLPPLDRPFTSVQVHSANAKSKIIESKFYDIGSSMPAQCSVVATNCFLSGSLDIEHCYHCTLLEKKMAQNSECFKYVSKEAKELIEKDTPIKAQEEQAHSADHKLIESIDVILKAVYKSDKDDEKKELITLEEVDENLKKELANYCTLLKEVDTSGTLNNHKLANEIETYRNLTRLLRMHSEENVVTLQDKLRNAAICIKDIDKWIINKRGLSLPDGTPYYSEENTKEYLAEEFLKEIEKEKNACDDDAFDKDTNGVIDLNKIPGEMKFKSPYFKKSKYCNNEYCDRWKDKTSCISNIEVEEQGDCGLCWIFASKLHVETIRCMRGYGHFRSSALFVANCSKRSPEDRCNVGSNPTEFLQIVKDTGFLPLESDLPYNYSQAGNSCPNKRSKWTNLWGNTKLLYHKRPNHLFQTFGYVSYESKRFENNIDLFIDILKREVQNKGSVIIYIKTENVIDYDFNGKVVHSLCGHNDADHAANIIGYGNYINVHGEKRSYWLVRNSWGYYWGDEGNFKVDMYGPDGCKRNFIHTAVVFKIDLGIVEVPKKDDRPFYNYFIEYVPNFLYNLFYSSYDKGDDSNTLCENAKGGEAVGGDSVVDGQAVVTGQTETPTPGAAQDGAQPGAVGSEVNAAAGDNAGIVPPVGSQTGAVAQESGAVTPETGAVAQESGVVAPQAGAIATQNGADTPQAGDIATQTGADTPQTGDIATQNGADTPQTGDIATQNGADTPQNGVPAPQTTAAASPPSVTPLNVTVEEGQRVGGVVSLIPVDNSGEKKIPVMHILKYVKETKMTRAFVRYDSLNEIESSHSCSRTYAKDEKGHEECIQFCLKNWASCRGHYSPGYCLTKMYAGSNCFFCSV
ncbi:serine-repeat antigen [Plasmodium cynomolgi strain B]|uniref:Serine-repeat antigen n=2 Tax=Plasmodium cynomolgi TaxID=5827 RepID=K6UCK8_PLACD|nr:serine-repeat antigen [Plasmodium cynomolgi strain B]BAK08409.1 putative papain-like cysteine prorease [Plasmodium cynomolgi]GAB65026.1 serine-repeat antigen [Plasmodium cynomolgi strain B]